MSYGNEIFVTGSKGFIANHFDRALIDETVFMADADLVESWDWYDKEFPWSTIKLIIHQGAISSTTETDPRILYKYNVESSIKLFEKAIEYQIPVKYASSASVYGNESVVSPLNQYALSKVQVDYWVLDHLDEFSSIQGFRYFNVYGSGEENKGNQASPVSTFTKQAKEDGIVKIFEGSVGFYRDFVWVGDIVNLVLDNDKPSGIYDLGTSKPISFSDVAEIVANKYDAKIETIPFPSHLKKKYQTYTRAKNIWDYKFKSVEEYVNEYDIS